MAFRSVGTNLSGQYVEDVGGLASALEALKSAGPDFVEVWPQNLGIILGGRLDTNRLWAVGELLETELAYTVHAPLEVNLMDLTSHGLQRDVLDASLRFAKGIGAEVVVCHAGQRVGARDARHSMRDQLSAERSGLRVAGESGRRAWLDHRHRELLP
jgi:sugar phosphate isomerase/epimerase